MVSWRRTEWMQQQGPASLGQVQQDGGNVNFQSSSHWCWLRYAWGWGQKGQDLYRLYTLWQTHRSSETQFQTWLLVSLWRDPLGQVPALRGPYSRGLDQGIWGTLPSIWLRLERHHNHSWQRSSWAPFRVPLLEVLQDLQADFISGKPESQWEVTCRESHCVWTALRFKPGLYGPSLFL